MSDVIAGTFNGTGAAVTICLGFIPDWVKVRNLENSGAHLTVEWSKHMRTAEMSEGLLQSIDIGGNAYSAGTGLTRANAVGVTIYRGGVYLASASSTILVRDPNPDKRSANVANGYAKIDTWTLGSSSNRTGSWNDECNTTYVGEGSRITIQESGTGLIKTANVVALSSNGEAANEVTLDEAIGSGKILALSGMYDWIGAAANTITPKGFVLSDVTANVSGEYCMFEAGTYR
jgi:hypothetical protein